MHPYFGTVCALIGSFVSFSFGLWNESLTILVLLMGIDYISGIVASLREGQGLHSETGFWGLAKKGLILLIVLLSHRIDILMGGQLVMGGAVTFYTINELLSVLENYGRIGLPLPPQLKRVVRVLRNRTDDKPKEP